MQKTFNLPPIRCLQRFVKNWPEEPGISDTVFNSIKIRTDTMEQMDRICVLCLDEMSIKSSLFYSIKRDKIIGFHDTGSNKSFNVAQNALVIMARGLKKNWKQPLGYFLTPSTCPTVDVKNVIECTIKKLHSINIQVVAVVTDQGSNFRQLIKLYNLTIEKPYFMINNMKIFYFFYMPHIIKVVRNNMITHNFIYDNQHVSWQYIKSFFEQDKRRNLRLAPKLTNEHIYPNNWQKMRVKYAQVLSATVAASLKTYISFGALGQEVMGTANFISDFDKLFDIFNSSQLFNAKQFNKPFKGEQCQIDFLHEILDRIRNMKIINFDKKDKTKQIKFVFTLQLTINALLQLWESLQIVGFKYILTRRINQDCLENYFGIIRKRDGNSCNPTPQQFINAFKKTFSLKFLIISENTNCADDFFKFLALMNSVHVNVCESNSTILQTSAFNSIKLLDLDSDRNHDFLTENSLQYLCGYIIRKLRAHHICPTCETIALQNLLTSNTTVFIEKRAYNKSTTFGSLLVPSNEFYNYILKLHKHFLLHFELYALQNIGRKLFEDVIQMTVPFKVCAEFP